jgi:hypothetical protein
LVYIHLQLSSLRFKLFIFLLFLLDLTAELQLHALDRFHSLVAVLLKLCSLHVEAFLIILFLLYMLALDDFLSLLGYSVELHIFGAFLEIDNLQLETFIFVLNLLETCLELQNLNHVRYLFVASPFNLLVLFQNNSLLNQDGIFVVCCYWELGNFNLPLLEVDDHFEVILKLLDSRLGLPLFIA